MAARNPSVREILKLAYEFEHSVARPGRTAADWFLDFLYHPTKLDQDLLPNIMDDQFDLVLITGNPGDGKSAFLNRLPDDARTASGRRILVRHDATEPSDPNDRTASAINDLAEFLSPLTDEAWNPAELEKTMFVVGVNKGLLVRAFRSPGTAFVGLQEALVEAMESGRTVEEPVRVCVVDLNKRSLSALPLESSGSLVDQLVERLVDTSLWEEKGCANCELAGWCPFLTNAKYLREDEPKKRIKLLWLLQELRSEHHSTIRDILAALAYVIVGHEDMFREGDDAASRILEPCEFVEREHACGSSLALFRRVLYNALATDGDVYEGHATVIEAETAPVTARTYGMAPFIVREAFNGFDPANHLSNGYWDQIEETVLIDPVRAANRHAESARRAGRELEAVVFKHLCESLESVAERLQEGELSEAGYKDELDRYHWLVYILAKTVKRRTFLCDPISLTDFSSYASLADFIGALKYLSGVDDDALECFERAIREVIPRGLMQSEGIIPTEERPGRIETRWSRGREEVGAVLVRRMRGSDLTLEDCQQDYVEVIPRRLQFRHPSIEATLMISMATFEGLYRLSMGFHDGFAGVARSSQLRNFREAMRNVKGDEDIVIRDFLEPSATLAVNLDTRIAFD